jgi:hypothetical protein
MHYAQTQAIQHRRIIGAGKPCILNPHQIQFRPTPQQATDDVVVEILIDGKAQHRLSPLRAAVHQTFTHAFRIKAGFVFAPDL